MKTLVLYQLTKQPLSSNLQLLFFIIATFLIASCEQREAVVPQENTNLKVNESLLGEWNPENLPGTSYGFDWPSLPPLPPDPQGPEPWETDLSVAIEQVGTVSQETKKRYFVVKYKLLVKNRDRGPLTFHVKVGRNYNPPPLVLLDPSLVNAPHKFHHITNLRTNSPAIIEDTIHVNYPYTISRNTLEKTYLQIPVDVVAEIRTYGFRSNGHTVIVFDPNREDNIDEFTITAPKPKSYVIPNTH